MLQNRLKRAHNRFRDRIDDRINPIFSFSGKRDLSSVEFHGARN